MKKTKFLSVILCVALLLSSISLTAMAISFDDVESDATVSWAKDSIHKMSDAGYIKGYEDGTFRPYRAITTMECLILMSRMLGFENPEFADAVNTAASKFETTAAKYNSTYAKEISYLLYCGVLDGSDLVDYASVANSNTPLLRYRAAILMAKLLGANEEAKAYTVATPTYADNTSIPTNARAYVEYVTANGVMNGMDKTEDGEPQFSPITSLTRAQMATLLARLMDKLDIAYVSGTVEDVTASSVTVDGTKIEIADTTELYGSNGNSVTDAISEGDTASVVVACDKAYAINVNASNETSIVYGVVVRKSENSEGKKITIADYEDEEHYETYTLKNNCSITVGSSKGNFADIMSKDFVKLELVGGKITALSTSETKLDISGKLVSVDYDNDNHVYLNVGDANGNNVQNYVVSTKGALVERDGVDSSFRELSAGDSVTLRLTYGKVTRVTATSSSERISGLLSEIIISSNPAVTITQNGTSNTYKLRSDVKITVAGKNATIYDLRPNITVNCTLDSSEVKTLSASTVAVTEEGEMEGTVTGKNTTYKVLTIEDADGNQQSVYYNTKTNFLNASGQTSNIQSIQEGSKVRVVGAEKNGLFEATIIILK